MASHYFQIVVISVADSEPYWNSDIFIFETGPIVRWWDFDFIVGIWSGWYMYCVVLILNKVPCNNKCHFWILSVTGRRSPDWLDQIAAGGITEDRSKFLSVYFLEIDFVHIDKFLTVWLHSWNESAASIERVNPTWKRIPTWNTWKLCKTAQT